MPEPDPSTIRNHHPAMAYRRFGRTRRWLSAITLGGMRYQDSGGEPRQEPTAAMIRQCADCTRMALERGINHIETAYGYGKSEHCYGRVLNEELAVPRHRYHLMTKGAADTAESMRALPHCSGALPLRSRRRRMDLPPWLCRDSYESA